VYPDGAVNLHFPVSVIWVFKQAQDEVLLFKVEVLLLTLDATLELERGAFDQGGKVFV
jgi:hypothetical protein